MDTNGSKNWVVYLVSPRIPYIKKGPLEWHEALVLIEEERNAGMLPLLDYCPVEDAQPQTWRDIPLDEPQSSE